MALIKCKECGKKVSKRAESCPECGVPMKKKGKNIGCFGTIFLIVIAIIVITQLNSYKDKRAQIKAVAKQQEITAQKALVAQEKKAAEDEKHIQFFNANKQDILTDIQALYDSGKYLDAEKKAKPYLVANNTELNNIYQNSKAFADGIRTENTTKEILSSLKNIPAAKAKINLDLYTELVSLNPDVQKYKDKVEHYTVKLEQEQKNKQAVATRKKQIEDQFSGWDGSHVKLTRYIKEHMKDPDSYDHVETRFGDKGDHILVVTKYRGKNSFGALVVQATTATVDFNGNILSVE